MKSAIFFFLIILSLLKSEISYTQELSRQVISSLGANYNQNNLIINSTAGQPFGTNTTYSSEENYRPGFQQPPFHVSVLKSIIETNVYPNPTIDAFHIVASKQINNCYLKITDVNGKELFYNAFETFKKSEISCKDWPSGNYFTTIILNNSEEIYSNKITIIR
jgi:hypothetical protein